MNLLFGIPLIWGVCITALDVLVVMYLQNKGFRYIEALVDHADRARSAVASSRRSSFRRPDIVRACSAGSCRQLEIVTESRDALHRDRHPRRDRDAAQPVPALVHRADAEVRAARPAARREAIKFATIDSTVALMFALFINAAILIVAAATFYGAGGTTSRRSRTRTNCCRRCSACRSPARLFALALLASGQNSTLTGTLAGQIVMEGFLKIRLRPWLRRLITRLIAIVPAVIVTALYGEHGTAQLLVLEPGDSEPAAVVRRDSAGHVHEQPGEDGRVRQSRVDQGAGVDDGGAHRDA